MKSFNKLALFAGVAELADAQDLGCSPSHFPTSLLSVSACVFIARSCWRWLVLARTSWKIKHKLSTPKTPEWADLGDRGTRQVHGSRLSPA